MSVFRVILIILNLLAALAFGYFAFQDYRVNRDWSIAAFVNEHTFYGLPLNQQTTNAQGRPAVDDLDDDIKQEIFKGIDGPPVKTQVEEVERLRQVVQQNIDKSPNKPAELVGILLPLARTPERRELLIRRLKDTKNTKFDDLQADLNGIFDDALSDTQPGRSDKRDPEESKMAIGRLLFGLTEYMYQQESAPNTAPPGQPEPSAAQAVREDQKLRLRFDSKAYRRAMTVVGVETASKVTDEQANKLETMLEVVNKDIASDRNLFASDYYDWVDKLTHIALELEQQQLVRKRQETLVQDQLKVLNDSREKLGRVREQLLEAQRKTRGQLKEQSDRESEMFQWQQFLGNALQENLRLERLIRSMELGQ